MGTIVEVLIAIVFVWAVVTQITLPLMWGIRLFPILHHHQAEKDLNQVNDDLVEAHLAHARTQAELDLLRQKLNNQKLTRASGQLEKELHDNDNVSAVS